jgi:CheY-like chemotaxis protein
VKLRVFVEGGDACVVVQDNGIGIEPAMLERIFEPFVQIERRDSSSVGGIGVGLALARALVQLHGGTIKAQSDGGGKGSRFIVCLPLAAAPELVAEDAAPARGAGRRFLVVDDNVDATVTQALLLRRLGHQVETAFSGPVAIEKARAFRPDIVLLDIGMPGMDGFEVARRLRTMPEARGALIVAQTGWGQEEDRRRTKAAGFDAHLAKPVDVAALMRLV